MHLPYKAQLVRHPKMSSHISFFKFLDTKNFLNPQIPKMCNPILVTLMKM